MKIMAMSSGREDIASVDYGRLEVHRLGFWVWHVHENQSYLGRMIIKLRRSETGSLAGCTEGEWRSLRENIRRYEVLMCRLFSPERFNYSQMGNVYPQLHVQAVPRYASTRMWGGHVFEDRHWGANWAPTPHSPLTVDETYQFADWLRGRL